MKTQVMCHPDRKHYCKGLCKSCYYRPYRIQKRIEGVVYPSHTPESKRRDHLKPLGWFTELFEKVLKQQGRKCAICRKPLNLEKVQNGARACADHEHTDPPKPRGIICTNCNAGIGQFKDNPKVLRRAAEYLEKY